MGVVSAWTEAAACSQCCQPLELPELGVDAMVIPRCWYIAL